MSGDQDPVGLDRTALPLAAQTLVLTRADAVALGAALIEAIRRSASDTRARLLPQVEGLTGWIDYDGAIRLGRWLLVTGRDPWAFMLRPPPDPEIGLAQYVAPVRRTPSGWTVGPLDQVRLIRGR